MALRVFISHAGPDSAFAQRLASDLRSVGADVWLDASHIGPGNFVQRINAAINARDVLVLVLTPDALASRWVPDEMDAALVRYKQSFMRSPAIVMARPVALQDIPALWTTYNRIDATTDYDQALPGIMYALGLTPPASLYVPPQYQSVPPPTMPYPQSIPPHTPYSTTIPSSGKTFPPAKTVPMLSRRNLLIGAGGLSLPLRPLRRY